MLNLLSAIAAGFAKFVVIAAVVFPIVGALMFGMTFLLAHGLERDSGTAFVMLMCFFVNPWVALIAAGLAGGYAASRTWNPYPWLVVLAIALCGFLLTREASQAPTDDPWPAPIPAKTEIKVIAFDCFGTVFDMSSVPRSEIADYVKHVRGNDFSEYDFPESWYELPAHPDAAEGIKRLRDGGYLCVALSNGSYDLLYRVSERNGIKWDRIIDLSSYRVYKPHLDAYRTVEKETQFKPFECLMITANPTFGDVEGAAAIGMTPQVIRHPDEPATIIELAERLGC